MKVDSTNYLIAAVFIAGFFTLALICYWHHCEEMAKISTGVKAQEGGAK